MIKYQLGEEQVQALQEIKDFLAGDEPAFCLYGSAGTGKSFMVSRIIDLVKELHKNYALIAPTHKATLVMKEYTGEDALTIHSLLALSPNLEILKLDLSQLLFQSKNSKNIPEAGVVICDEASMINDDLFDLLIEKCSELQTKVIFIGDIKQLQPVEGRNYSKVFGLPLSFELTKIYRQNDGSAIAPLLQKLRLGPLTRVSTKEAELGSLYVYDEIKPFADEIVSHIRAGMKKRDVLYAKVLAYTNSRVSEYNKTIHRLACGDDELFYKGEIMTAYSNFNGFHMSFVNGMDYIIVEPPVQQPLKIKGTDFEFNSYKLRLYDQLENACDYVTLIDPATSDLDLIDLAGYVETMRQRALKAQGKEKHMYWGRYFKLVKDICYPRDVIYDERVILKKSMDYGYAITVHKSQGSSIENIFVDLKDIRKRSGRDELRQLEYVALSRARKNVFIYK